MAQNTRLNKDEIQEDKFIEFVLQCYTFLKDNVRTISISLAVVIIGLVSYIVYTHNQEKKYAEASVNFNDVIQTYKDAETDFLDVSTPSESQDETSDETEIEKVTLADAAEKQQQFFEKYPNTTFADKARFNYAKSLYYQGNYPEARVEFEKVANTDKPENQLYALYAQKAIGNCYEQEGEYAKAITAYDQREFPDASQIDPAIRQFVITSAKYNQALCHEQLNAIEDAKATYKDIIDEFQTTLNVEIEKKSSKLIKDAKSVVTIIETPLDLAKAEQLEADELYFDSLVAYTDTIRAYKVEQDIAGGLLTDVRKRIRTFEEVATTAINNIQSARRSEKSGYLSSALSVYDRVIGFDTFGLNSRLYEHALLNYDRLTLTEKRESNEEK